MKVIKYQLLLAAALLTGVAIGYFAGGSSEKGEKPATAEKKPSAKGKTVDRGEDPTVVVMRRRIAELERLLAERRASGEGTEERSETDAAADRAPDSERPRLSMRERMEELKKNNPERYAQITNHMARMRKRGAERARSAVEFLSSVDTSRMSSGAKKTHDELQELIVRREELEEKLHQEGLSDDERHQLHEQLRSTDQAMRQLNRQERTNLIEETAKSLGFAGQDVKEISSTIQEVIEATEGGRGFGPPPPGGPGGR